MSLITCTNDCVYQEDGYCGLERIASCGKPEAADEACVHFVERNVKENKRLAKDTK